MLLENKLYSWLKKVTRTAGLPKKRTKTRSQDWVTDVEFLESRLALSATGAEALAPEVAEVTTFSPRTETGPLSGLWSVRATTEGQPEVAGQATIKHEGRKVEAQFTFENGNRLEVKGRTSKSNANHFEGKIKGSDSSTKGRVVLDLTGSQFQGTVTPKGGGTLTVSGISLAATDTSPTPRKAVAFPAVSGVWNLTVVADIDGDIFNYTGQVTITQKKGKIVGSVNLVDLPNFEFKGKLGKSDPLVLNGKSKIPVDVGDGDFRFIRGSMTANFASNLLTFNGDISRSIFGTDINISITAVKQAAPV